MLQSSPLAKHQLGPVRSDLLVLRTPHTDIKLMRCTYVTWPNPQKTDFPNLWKNNPHMHTVARYNKYINIKLQRFSGKRPQLLKVIKRLSFCEAQKAPKASSLRNPEVPPTKFLCESQNFKLHDFDVVHHGQF